MEYCILKIKQSGWITSLIVAAAILSGCSGVHHTSQSYCLVGQPYPIEVHVSLKETQTASGTVYYRSNKNFTYYPLPLLARGGGRVLSATLPASLSIANQTIEYYIDVMKNHKPYALRSPAVPYHVNVLTKQQLIYMKLRSKVKYGTAGDTVTFVLQTGDLRVNHASLTYQAPGLPGVTTTPLRHHHHGQMTVTIPGRHVQAGWWNYRIEAEVDGVYRVLPDDQDWDSFEVKQKPITTPPP